MTWAEIDWPALDRLRDGFLHGGAAAGPYWRSTSDLASYDFTYGERIGWKWDHVLRELRLRGWQPKCRCVFDWGCGSGIAGRRVVSAFGPEAFDELIVWDHSPLACDFAEETAARAFPSLRVSAVTPGFLAGDAPVGLLLVSHVLNELAPEALAALQAMCARAEAVIWVEPGTHVISRQLGLIRDALLPWFQVAAPCTHQLGCPMFTSGRERDWCHFFAPPPPGIHADSDWVKFGQRAGIDLRSLPYAFMALERADRAPEAAATVAGATPPARAIEPGASAAGSEWSRVIGRPEHFKPYVRLLSCDVNGLADLELPKRADPALFKQLERTKAPLVYRWRRDGDKITGGEALGAAQP